MNGNVTLVNGQLEATAPWPSGMTAENSPIVIWTNLPVDYKATTVARIGAFAYRDKGLWLRAELDKASAYAREVLELIRAGKLQVSSEFLELLKARAGAVAGAKGATMPVVGLVATGAVVNARGLHHYRLAKEVDASKVEMARLAARYCADDLGLLGWRLKWFEDAKPGDEGSFALPEAYAGFVRHGERTVYVHAGTPLGEIKQLVAHECLHAHHQVWHESRGVERPADEEADAESYGRYVAGLPLMKALMERGL